MADQQNSADDDATIPKSRSSGNQGSRGSRGQANDGALPDNGSHDGRDKPPASQDSPELRGADAQGGGGVGSESSRSR